jgi:hypothetical protein
MAQRSGEHAGGLGRKLQRHSWLQDGYLWKKIIVADQNGRILERVDVLYNANGAMAGFQFNAAASLDLVGGSSQISVQPVAVDIDAGDSIACTVSGTVADNQSLNTPTGALKQAAGVRPTNTVICPIPASNSRHAFVTLGGGSLFVVDTYTTPMAIVAEYKKDVVHAAGCDGVEAADCMHLDTGTPGPNIAEFTLYRFPLTYPLAPAFNAANTPAPVAVWADADNGKIAGVNLPAGANRDAHGIVLVRQGVSNAPRYLHVFDRIRNNVEVFKVAPPWNNLAHRHEGTYGLTTTGACGSTLGTTQSNDPTPDLGDLLVSGVPDGGRIFVALREPFPLTVSHAAAGSRPGLGVVTLSPNRKSGALTHVLSTTVLNFTSTQNLSDPHAAIVRVKTP